MKQLWNTFIWTFTQRRLKTALVQLAQSTGVYLNPQTIENPMTLTPASSVAIVKAAASAIIRIKQTITAVSEALEQANAKLAPLEREKANMKIQLDQLNAADDQLDEELSKLREALDTADQPEVEEEAPPVTSEPGVEPEPATGNGTPVADDAAGPGPDETGAAGAEGTPSQP